MVNLGIINKSNFKDLPKYAKPGDAGFDIRADLGKEGKTVSLGSLGRKLIPTGIYLNIPEGYEVQVRPRSGLAIKEGITVLNSPGTIDSGYQGEVKIILVNLSDRAVEITHGQRIAQLVLAKVETAEIVEIEEFTVKSERGDGGFHSTGKH